MLPTILQHSQELIAFIALFNLALYQPQIRHLHNLVDAMLVCSGRKTLTNLYRQVAEEPDPKTAADFFRESPWEREDVGHGRKEAMLRAFLGFAQKLGLVQLLVSVDDSTGKKDKATRHLEAVCYHHDHNDGSKSKPKYVNGFVYVEVHIQIGPIGFTWDTRLYLRECIVHKLNRKRAPEERLHYSSKYTLTRAMLTELAAFLPEG
jgi:DDE superfamily endonuclease